MTNARDVALNAIPLLEDLRDLNATLTEDVGESALDAQRGGQRQRRAYVRTVFALVEGVLAGSKAFLLKVQPLFCSPLTPAEVCLLEERSYSLASDGEVKGRRLFLSVGENVRFTFGLVAKAFGAPLSLDYGGTGWKDFRTAVGIRNRLMHPQRLADCVVSNEEATVVDSAVKWFRTAGKAFFEAGSPEDDRGTNASLACLGRWPPGTTLTACFFASTRA